LHLLAKRDKVGNLVNKLNNKLKAKISDNIGNTYGSREMTVLTSL